MNNLTLKPALATTALAALAALAMASCSQDAATTTNNNNGSGNPPAAEPPSTPEPTDMDTPDPVVEPQAVPIANVAQGSQLFAIDFYNTILESQNAGENEDEEQPNIFFSPYSITTAYGMVYAGARGNTATQLQQALKLPQDGVHQSFKDLRQRFSQPDNDDYTLNTTNGIWAQQEYPFRQEYLDTVTDTYGARLENVDFKTRAEEIKGEINSWTSDNTEGLIKELIKDLDKLTRLVLVNAIYFKGTWKSPFETDLTSDRQFRTPSGTVNAPFMQHSDFGVFPTLKYAEDNAAQILELPYQGNDISMLIILPKEDNPATVEQMLNAEQLSQWRQQLQYKDVEVLLPKFKTETEYNLTDELPKMGVTNAFTSAPPGSDCQNPNAVPPASADFQGIDGSRCLYISESTHKAVVEVNEAGTEAAAATSVVLATVDSAPPPPIPFVADHPFIFIIQDTQSGTILFMGKINDPTK